MLGPTEHPGAGEIPNTVLCGIIHTYLTGEASMPGLSAGDIHLPSAAGEMGLGLYRSAGIIHTPLAGDVNTIGFGESHIPPVIGDMETPPARLFDTIPIIPTRLFGTMETPPHSYVAL